MRTLLLIVAVLVMSAVQTKAEIKTTPAEGALGLTLWYHHNTGNAWLFKNTDYDSDSLDVNLYEIWHKPPGGYPPYRLDPAGWYSLTDAVADAWAAYNAGDTAPLEALLDTFGSGVFGFGEIKALSQLLAEATLSGYTTFQPDAWWSIGRPFQTPAPPKEELYFYYTKPGVVGDKFLGVIVPEPATLVVLAASVPLLLRRKPKSR